ncbi:MAG TPA: hypothetical protein VNR11_21660 [Xanthobacteraceae bacterium]|nr:hypothetical protein [Xanthobacteraceae bacterium]
MFTERDTVNADGTFNRRIILKVALSRARAERDLDMLVAAHGPTLRPPTGISQDAVRAWRRARCAGRSERTRAGTVPHAARGAIAARLVRGARGPIGTSISDRARARREWSERRDADRGMSASAYARLAGLLKSDLTTIEIALESALRLLDHRDLDAVRRAVGEALLEAREAQGREAASDDEQPSPHSTAPLQSF